MLLLPFFILFFCFEVSWLHFVVAILVILVVDGIVAMVVVEVAGVMYFGVSLWSLGGSRLFLVATK
jgi:hypothetical protein